MRPLRCSGRRQTHSSQKPLRETSRRNGLAPLRHESQEYQSNWSNQANSTFFLSECQCSICHDWFRGKDGSEGAIFPGNSFYIAKRCPYKWVASSGGRGSLSGGGAVMAPLRRAGLTGSLPVQGNRSDLGLRGREGCPAGLPFRSAPLREADREAGRGRGSATGARGDGSRW